MLYYGPIDILPASTKFTLSLYTNLPSLYTNEGVVRLTFNGSFWEMIVNGSGTYSPDQSIFKDNNYDRVAELFFDTNMTTEINAILQNI